MELSTAQRDRACGVLLATGAGDALGAPYEFGPPLPAEHRLTMSGGGPWGPGEWTDDTSMAIAIAEIAATGADLVSTEAQDQLVRRWSEWMAVAKDVGIQTQAVLSRAESAAQARQAAADLHARTGQTAGNGSLMRTAPVALAYLDDEDGLVKAATAISTLTHFDPEAAEACVLWCLAIRHAVLTGELDVRVGLPRLDPARREAWAERIDSAERATPADFARNGWVVEALQGAWSAIAHAVVPTGAHPAERLRLAIEAAVRGGRDADTVAAIAGGLVGAVHGASAVPAEWRRVLHGWPGTRARDLVALATAIVSHGQRDTFDYTYLQWAGRDVCVRHPYDDELWLAGVGLLHALPPGVDAVVSLCRIGDEQLPAVDHHVEVWLIDRASPAENANLGFVLNDTVDVIERMRAEGHTVLLHCVQAQSRTPAVAALYGMRLRGVSAETALADIRRVLPDADPNPAFIEALSGASS